MLFRMVPKLGNMIRTTRDSFRAVLFRMVPKRGFLGILVHNGFRAVLFRMVPKPLQLLK